MTESSPTARVALAFRTPEDGGRPSAVNSGYRAQVSFATPEGQRIELDCLFDFRSSHHAFEQDHDKWLPLGVEDTADIRPYDAARMRAVATTGTSFDIYEGLTKVGSGRLLTALA